MEILFNSVKAKQKAGTKCETKNIESVVPTYTITDKLDLPAIQPFDCGYKVNSTNLEWSNWNGCIFVDVDAKKYYEEQKQFNIEKYVEGITNSDLFFDDNFYFMQESFSGNGSIHYVFYYDIEEKNIHTFESCMTDAVEKVKSLYISCGGADIINYIASDGQPVLDKHNNKAYQILFVCDKTIYYGNNCNGYSGNVDLSENNIEKEVVDSMIINADDYEVLDEVKNKVKVDRKFRIGQYSGCDLRWRISSIAYNLFGENGKEWCDKYFYYENCKSIFQEYDYGTNKLVLNWLISNKYITKKEKGVVNKIDLNDGEWISDKIEELTSLINKYNRVEIVAGTGIGKTTLINKHNDSFFDNFSDGLANIYNAIVLVPYNVTNKLYDKLLEISSSNNNKIEDCPCVMIFDQAVKHWEEIKDRNIIIDEAHTLFTERSFRDNSIKLVELIRTQHTGKLICVTATPTGECEMLKLNKIVVNNNKSRVVVGFEYAKYIDRGILDIIKYALNCWNYDRIVVMDDNNAEKIVQNLIHENICQVQDIAYLRASTKDTEDYNYVIENEILNKMITVCTRVAYNGLNFKNENEKVLILSSYTPMQNIAAEYIQIIGRIRRSQVTCLILYSDEFNKDYENFDIVNKREKIVKEILKNANNEIYSFNDNCDDKEWIAAQKEIETYKLTHSYCLQAVIDEMQNYDYIVTYKTYLRLNLRNRLAYEFKIMESNKIKNYMKENTDWHENIDNTKFTDTKYAFKWMADLKWLLEKYDCKKIIEYIEKQNARIDTTIDNVKFILSIASLSDDEFHDYIYNLDIIKSEFYKYGWMTEINYLDKKRKKIFDIRAKWNATVMDENRIDGLFRTVVCDLEEFLFEVTEKKIDAGKTGGKVCKKVTVTENIKESRIDLLKKYNLSIGQEFDSCGDIAKYINKSNKTVSEWMNKGWIA